MVVCSFKFLYPLGQLLELLSKLRQTQHLGNNTGRLSNLNRGTPDHFPAGRHALDNARLSTHHRTRPYLYIIRQAHLARQYNAVTNFAATGDTNECCYQAALAYHNIMGDLHEVIYFRTGPNYGISEFRPVNAAVGPYFNIVFYHDSAVVWDEPVSTIQKAVPKTGRANSSVSLYDHIVAQQAIMIENDIAIQPAILTDSRIFTNSAPTADLGMCTYLNIIINHGIRCDGYALAHPHVLTDPRTLVYSLHARLEIRGKYIQCLYESCIDIFDNQLRLVKLFEVLADDNGPRAGFGCTNRIFFIRDESNFVLGGCFYSPYTPYQPVALPITIRQLSTKPFSQLSYRQFHFKLST
jgi:hypothetical protein